VGEITAYHLSLNQFFFSDQATAIAILNKQLAEIPVPLSSVNLIISAWTIPFVDCLSHAIAYLSGKKFNNIHLIFDLTQKKHNSFSFPTTYVNSMAIMGAPLIESNWHYKNNIGLLLTGRLEKVQRIGLLYSLYQRNLLTPANIHWSFPMQPINKTKLAEVIGTKADISEFLDYCNNNKLPDDNSFINNESNSLLIYTMPTDSARFNELYASTSFSIISETFYTEDEIFITEKVYRAISYKHPFILVGTSGSLLFLKDLGFRTFDNYLPISTYDALKDAKERMTAIVTNIAAFPSIIKEYRYQIEEDIEYNYQHLKNLVVTDKNLLKSLYEQNNLDTANLEYNMDWSFTGHQSPDTFVKNVNKLLEKMAKDNGYASVTEYMSARFNQNE
jgi:hypothetical protein